MRQNEINVMNLFWKSIIKFDEKNRNEKWFLY